MMWSVGDKPFITLITLFQQRMTMMTADNAIAATYTSDSAAGLRSEKAEPNVPRFRGCFR